MILQFIEIIFHYYRSLSLLIDIAFPSNSTQLFDSNNYWRRPKMLNDVTTFGTISPIYLALLLHLRVGRSLLNYSRLHGLMWKSFKMHREMCTRVMFSGGAILRWLLTRNNANEMREINEVVERYPTSSFDPLFM